MDEPTNYLDAVHIEWLKRYLLEYENAFILISHDIPFLNSVVNLIYHMENQELNRYVGDYDKFMEVYEMKKAQREAAYNRQQKEIAELEDFVARNKARVATRNMAMSRQKKLDKMDIIEKAVEKPKPEFNFQEARTPGRYIIQTKGLVIGYDEPLSRPLDFTMERGEKVVLFGANGIGKTTLLKSILNPGLTDSGSVLYDKQAGFIMEDAPFIEGATLRENMELFKNLYNNYDEEEFYTRIKSVGLGAHKVYGLLSKGEKVRSQFAFAMGHHPELLLLDEPTSGLDVAFRREFLYMLQEAVEKEMVSVIISTHLTGELERIADFIGVMDNGTLSFEENLDMAEVDVAGTAQDEKVSRGKIDAPDLKELVCFCHETYIKSGFVSYLLCVCSVLTPYIIEVSLTE